MTSTGIKRKRFLNQCAGSITHEIGLSRAGGKAKSAKFSTCSGRMQDIGLIGLSPDTFLDPLKYPDGDFDHILGVGFINTAAFILNHVLSGDDFA